MAREMPLAIGYVLFLVAGTCQLGIISPKRNWLGRLPPSPFWRRDVSRLQRQRMRITFSSVNPTKGTRQPQRTHSFHSHHFLCILPLSLHFCWPVLGSFTGSWEWGLFFSRNCLKLQPLRRRTRQTHWAGVWVSTRLAPSCQPHKFPRMHTCVPWASHHCVHNQVSRESALYRTTIKSWQGLWSSYELNP